MSLNSDLIKAQSEIKWFFKDYEIYSVSSNQIKLTVEFSSMYPLLSKLIEKSRITEFMMNNENYRIYGWDTIESNTCGWVCKINDVNTKIELRQEHKLLTSIVGGIKETWDEKDEIEITDALTINQNFLFIPSLCEKGIGFNREYYLELCTEKGYMPLTDFDNLVRFAQEANGNMTLYNPDNGKLYLFCYDHDFNYVTPINNQPEYTFYYLNGCENFVSYVEKIAEDWLKIIPATARL